METQQPLVIVERVDGAAMPRYQTAGSAGMDLAANNRADIVLAPNERILIPTGLKMAIPQGYEGQIRPRSGFALKSGVTVLNSPGTVDSDYRGEVKVLLINLGSVPVSISRGERIAQIVFAPTCKVTLEDNDGRYDIFSTPDTGRGTGGFGHTGNK